MSPDQLDLLSGPQRKERARSEHDEHKQAAIVWLRKQLAQLYRLRAANAGWPLAGKVASVDADDARRIYDRSNFPQKYSLNSTFFGSLFRGAEWETVGRKNSTFPRNNAREIRTWKYVGD